MAAPTATTSARGAHYNLGVTGTNVDAGNNDYTLSFDQHNLEKGFSIVTGTLTAMTVTVLAYNFDSAKAVDVTVDLFGVSSLASTTGYACNVPIPYNFLIIRAARTNATNAIYLEIFAPRR